jgi:hypothetical protein
MGTTNRKPIVWFASATWFMIGMTLASCGGKTSVTGESSPAGWTTVATFNGTGDTPQNTPPFTVHGGKVRFRFTVKPNDSGPVPFLSQMFPEGAPVSPNEFGGRPVPRAKGSRPTILALFGLAVITYT